MSVLFMDGCSHYATNDATTKYYVAPNVTVRPPAYGGNRREDAGYLQLGGSSGYVQTRELFETTELVAGLAMYAPSTGPEFAVSFIKNNTIFQVTLHYDGSQLHIRRGDQSGTILGSSAAGAVPENTWFYLEFHAVCDNAAGSTEVRINGIAVAGLTLSGQDTQADASSGHIQSVRVRSLGAANKYICDIYVDSDTLRGDVIVDTVLPTADGSASQWTPLTGSNFENVDDDGDIDGDLTYNSSTDNGDYDLFDFATLTPRPASPILAVCMNMTARKDDAEDRDLRGRTYVGGSLYTEYPVRQGLSSSYETLQAIWEDNPDDSQAWQESDINGAEFGYQQVVS